MYLQKNLKNNIQFALQFCNLGLVVLLYAHNEYKAFVNIFNVLYANIKVAGD